jgi:hypothetical protein
MSPVSCIVATRDLDAVTHDQATEVALMIHYPNIIDNLDEWREWIAKHGFDLNECKSYDEETGTLFVFLLDDQGKRYLDPETHRVAVRQVHIGTEGRPPWVEVGGDE